MRGSIPVRGVVALGLCAVLALPDPAAAINLNEWIPGLTLSPFLSERVEYETNVFQTPRRAQSDVVFKTIPGFLADYTRGPVALSTGYRTEILRYLDLEDQSTEHHIAVGQFKLDLPRLDVTLRDEFTITSEPPGSELTGRIRSMSNLLTPEAEYRLTQRFAVGLNYAWSRTTFEGGSGAPSATGDLGRIVEQLDRDEHLIGTSVFWKFQPKSDLRLDYAYGVKSFSEASDRDVTRHILTAGLRGDLTAKLSSTFRLGVEHRDPEGREREGYTGLIVGGGWIFTPTDRTKVTLDNERSLQESVFATNPYYVATSSTLTLEQELLNKLRATLRLGLGENTYPNKATLNNQSKFRRDGLLGGGAGLVYTIQPWLRLGIDYGYTKRDSNFDDFDFEDHKVSGRITFQF